MWDCTRSSFFPSKLLLRVQFCSGHKRLHLAPSSPDISFHMTWLIDKLHIYLQAFASVLWLELILATAA